jgi:hypothetical protein
MAPIRGQVSAVAPEELAARPRLDGGRMANEGRPASVAKRFLDATKVVSEMAENSDARDDHRPGSIAHGP